MQDRYKFRGKRIDNNQWYYGSYLYLHNPPKYDWNGTKHEGKEDAHFIIDEKDVNYGVYPETVGQCTGLKDKHGRLIFEGDIIKDKLEHIRVCVNEDDRFRYPALKTSRYFHKAIKNKQKNRCEGLLSRLTFQDNLSKNSKSEFEIVGNIYENEELLKEVE